MTDRILDLSEQPARLSTQNGLLKIQFRAEDSGSITEGEQTMPLADLAAVIVSHPQVSFTQAVLAGLAAAGGIFVACDEKRRPAAIMLPLVAHSLQAERFALQAALSAPIRKRLWQQIVRAKLAGQARLLQERTGQDWGLPLLSTKVRSGDPQNLEAHAARIYWRALFGGDFRRDREADDLNQHLNYGYAVLRAIVARAVCAVGLHPSLGLHHHNRYDSFCLADDLMEPFRPLADRAAAALRERLGESAPFDRNAKREIIAALLTRFDHGGESRTLFDWIARMASSLAGVIDGKAARLEIAAL
ncbi:MAG: type II CRISPR-associated endonuclease Cas1 [Terriglobia bacterium]